MKLRSSAPHTTLESVAQNEQPPKQKPRPEELGHKKTTRMKKKAPPKKRAPTKEEASSKKRNTKAKKSKKAITESVYRATLRPMIRLMEKIHGDITDAHRNEFEKTPFHVLFLMFYEKLVDKSHLYGLTRGITKVIDAYEVNTGFKIGNKYLKPKAEDVAVIFGLPMKGKEINPYNGRRDGLARNSLLNAKYFDKDQSEIKVSQVTSQIQKVVKIKGEEEDFVKLMVFYMLGTFLISGSTGSRIQTNVMEYVESYHSINNISWPRTIARYLEERISLQTIKQTQKATGCVLLLLYWLAEHSNIVEPIKGREERVPRAARWNLNKIASELQMKLPNLNGDEVSETFRVPLLEVEQNLLKDDKAESDEVHEDVIPERNVGKENDLENNTSLKEGIHKFMSSLKEVVQERDAALESYRKLVAEIQQKLDEKDVELKKVRKEIKQMKGIVDRSEEDEKGNDLAEENKTVYKDRVGDNKGEEQEGKEGEVFQKEIQGNGQEIKIVLNKEGQEIAAAQVLQSWLLMAIPS